MTSSVLALTGPRPVPRSGAIRAIVYPVSGLQNVTRSSTPSRTATLLLLRLLRVRCRLGNGRHVPYCAARSASGKSSVLKDMGAWDYAGEP